MLPRVINGHQKKKKLNYCNPISMKCPTTSPLTHSNNLRGQLESLGRDEESLVGINYHCPPPPNQPQWHHIFPVSQHLLHETKPKLNQRRAPTLLRNIRIPDCWLWALLVALRPSKHATLHLWPHTWTSLWWWRDLRLPRDSTWGSGSNPKQRQRMLLRPPSRCSPPQTAAKEGRPVSFTSGHLSLRR